MCLKLKVSGQLTVAVGLNVSLNEFCGFVIAAA